MRAAASSGLSTALLLLQGPLPSREQPATAFNDTMVESVTPEENLHTVPAQEASLAPSPVPQAYSLSGSGAADGSHSGNGSSNVVVIKSPRQRGESGTSAASGANVGLVSSSNGSLTAEFAASASSAVSHMEATEHSRDALPSDLAPSSNADRASSGETRWSI